MDIVYLVKNARKNEELIYSLRTLKNLPHDKVFIVGGCPDDVKKEKITYIPIVQTGNKFRNTANNLELICRESRLSEEFILMNDDFFILKPITDPATELNLCRGYVSEVIEEYTQKYGNDGNQYIVGMGQAKTFLEDIGIKNPLSYELHIPIVMAKNEVLRAFSLPYLKTIQPGHIRTIYGNLFKNGSKITNDVKVRVGHYKPIKSQGFLSTADNTWEYVKPYIHGLFPDKSEYEN